MSENRGLPEDSVDDASSGNPMVTTDPPAAKKRDTSNSSGMNIKLSVTPTHVGEYNRGVPRKYTKQPRIIDVTPNRFGIINIRIRDTKVSLRVTCWKESCGRVK